MTFKLAAFSESTYVFLIPNIAECQLQQQGKQRGSWVVLNKRKPRSLFLKLSAFTLLMDSFSLISPHSPCLRSLKIPRYSPWERGAEAPGCHMEGPGALVLAVALRVSQSLAGKL